MNNYVIPTIDWTAAMPVIVVFLTGIAALLVEMFRPRQNNNVIVGISLTGLAVAAYLLASQVGMPAIDTFAGMIRRDHLGLMLQLLMVVACGLTFLFGENYLRERRMAYGEFYPLAIWSTAGGMIMVGTDHLLMIFIGLEVLSISLYCMAGLAREEQRSAESALKYFLLGSLASAFLLYGIAFFYGATGTLSLTQIGMNGAQMNMQILATAFVLIGLGFKASLFPFHMWTPDVYQGAPTNVSAFLATVYKIAALGLMARMLPVLGQTQDFWFPVLFWLSMLTMTVGNVSAIGQTDLKRMLGFSSIAHAGYVMVALLAHLKNPKVVSLDAMVFYLAVYSVATIGADPGGTQCARRRAGLGSARAVEAQPLRGRRVHCVPHLAHWHPVHRGLLGQAADLPRGVASRFAAARHRAGRQFGDQRGLLPLHGQGRVCG
jgi:NADH-quinone oxidoreductase subunit N